MGNDEIVKMLEQAGIKPTSNRILVLRTILESDRPSSLTDLETKLLSLEKSSVFRVLTLLLEHGVVHAVEDGRGIVKYEICRGKGSCTIDDLHAHFYCESCHQVFCFETIHTPVVDLPDGFDVHSINYMVKGVCPQCKSANAHSDNRMKR
ncbi:MAG: transcriptional repressor [Alistipes sp.]|nr:transcriptional repressor [Alistipes senegalensis]MCM1250145.1 transcriptional repressor [Alistipes sp.]MCM1302047.1 transcriptional repressor [Bacteroides cellulosilyticus]MCM1352888.1 transcriptional repressor [Alistipes senegalensis]